MRRADGGRDASLDGLRGVAALAVVCSHIVFYLRLAPLAPQGGVGVLVFFVLSGYLIARIVARRRKRPHAYRDFLRRRAVRLGPAIAALAMVPVAVQVISGYTDLTMSLLYGAMALTQTMAFARAALLPVHPILIPTWSLTLEWTFYILLPGYYWALARRGRSSLTLASYTAIVAATLWLGGLLLHSPVAAYNLPVANLGVMFLGAALGLAHHAGWTGPARLRQGMWPSVAAVMIFIDFCLPGSSISWGYRLFVLPATAVSSALVVNGCVSGHPVQRLLRTRFLTKVGVRAYSLYLWHMSVLWITWHGVGSTGWATAWLVCLLLVPAVEISYRLLEAPALRAGTNALAHTAEPSAGVTAVHETFTIGP